MVDRNTSIDFGDEIYYFYHEIHVFVAPSLCVLGIIINVCLIVVLTRPVMRSAINFMLTAIAICETILMALYLTYLVAFNLIPHDNSICWIDRQTFVSAVLVVAYANLSIVIRACSLWLTVLMAIYRYHMMNKSVPNPTDLHKAPLLVGITVSVVAVFGTPVYLMHNIGKEQASKEKENCSLSEYYTVAAGSGDNLWLPDHQIIRLAQFTNGILFKFVPCCLLAIYLTRLGMYLCNYQRYRQMALITTRPPTTTLTPNSNNDNNGELTNGTAPVWESQGVTQISLRPGTLILTVIMMVTLVLEAPNAVFSLMVVLANDQDISMGIYKNLGDLFDLLALLATMSTFPLYCVMSSMFRQNFIDVFCCFRRQRTSMTRSPTNGDMSMFNRSSYRVPANTDFGL